MNHFNVFNWKFFNWNAEGILQCRIRCLSETIICRLCYRLEYIFIRYFEGAQNVKMSRTEITKDRCSDRKRIFKIGGKEQEINLYVCKRFHDLSWDRFGGRIASGDYLILILRNISQNRAALERDIKRILSHFSRETISCLRIFSLRGDIFFP